jgi:RNA polymerase sigma-70 factor (ECF subfamily)
MTKAEPQTASAEASSLAEASDQALVAAFKAGHREAFDVIVLRHQRMVYQLCRRFVSEHEDAADLAQDVFVRAFKGLRAFKGDAALATWLHRIAVNVCLNRVTVKRPAVAPIEAADRIVGATSSPLDVVMRDERADAVRRAIEQLPAKQKATVILRMYQDLSHEEIAAVMGGTVGAAKANLFHALGNLRRLLGKS